jgi:glycolate oxidase FAD binding subunit
VGWRATLAARGWDASAPRRSGKAGGHATLFRADDAAEGRAVGVFQPLPPPLLRIHRNLKHAFDPQGVFNPGRMYPGL